MAQVTLTPAQLSAMDTDGFIVLENLFDEATMAELDANLTAYQSRHEQDLIAAGGASGISRAGEILFTDHIAESEPSVLKFVKNEEMVSVATQLLGPDVDLYWNQTVYKSPETAKDFPWHQDDGYTAVDPAPYLTCWLAVTDATVENGCISVLPGSHRGGLRPHVQSPIGLVGYSNDEPDQGIPVPISKGSMIVFWSLVLHKSGPNVSNGVRKAYIIQYSKAGLRRVDSGELIEGLFPVTRDGAVA